MRAHQVPWNVRRARADKLGEPEKDTLAAEEPLEIRLNGRSLVVTMRTPGHDEDLARGFLLAEGILRPDAAAEARFAAITNPLDPAHDNIVHLAVAPEHLARNPASRTFHASSACGVCGQASLDDMARDFPRVDAPLRVSAATLTRMPRALRAGQQVFDATGGLHAAALATPDGRIRCLREDIGRHNAVDKLLGWAATQRALPLSEDMLVVSGRAGYEIVQKAAAGGIPLVAAVGAPSSLAARLAHQMGVTLVGFLKDEGFNVYTHPERIL